MIRSPFGAGSSGVRVIVVAVVAAAAIMMGLVCCNVCLCIH